MLTQKETLIKQYLNGHYKMRTSPLISIIIPVYGVEKYIEKCISSIKAQTFINFEALIINDGTKDQSINLAKKVINNDKRFIIINKENQGQGSARNLGLDLARGEYISFIDSDDYVEPEFLEELYQKITEKNSEICTCNIRYVDIKNNEIKTFKNNVEKYKSENDFLLAKWYISNFMWDKLFKREIFKEIRFDQSLKTNEDVHILFRIIYNREIVSTEKILYNYVQRPSATSKSAPKSYISDRVKIIKKQLEFNKQITINKDNSYITYVYLKHFIFNAIVTLSRYAENYDKDINILKKEIDKKYFTYKNIFFVFFMKENKTFFSLVLFKISPKTFQNFIKIFFKFRKKQY